MLCEVYIIVDFKRYLRDILGIHEQYSTTCSILLVLVVRALIPLLFYSHGYLLAVDLYR